MSLEKIYSLLPVSLQNLAISAYGYKWQKRRFGGIFNKEYHGFKERENFKNNQWRDYQVEKLREILLHSARTVPYYRELFKNIGLKEESLKAFTLEDLAQLPLLEKDKLREAGTTSLVSEILEKDCTFLSSSGSSGTPTKILYSKAMHQKWFAGYESRVRNWAGLSKDNARGMIGGRRVLPHGDSRKPFYRYNMFEKQVYFSAYHISKENVGSYLEGMNKYRVDYMMGYAMSNFFLARFIEESGLRAPKLKAVITSSESLTQEMRNTFMRVYHCRTYDSYSGVEACGLISECEHGRLHISPDLGIIEIIDQNGQHVRPGESGEAVCTSLLNFNQPLIRYRIGDILKLSKEQSCECGRQMPIVDEIVGRIEDTVIGKDGREMVRFHSIFVNIPDIIEGQVIQKTLDDFEIKVVASKKLEDIELNSLKERMISQLGPVNVLITEVENIPKGPNGKTKAVVSHVRRDSYQ